MIFYYFILTSLVILSARGEKKCKADSECKENEFCRGFCAPKPTAKPNFERSTTTIVAHHECQTDQDCPKDQICRSKNFGNCGSLQKVC